MIAKALEVRDEGTFIAVLAVDMNPRDAVEVGGEAYEAQRYLLRRCGYACDGRPNIILTRLDGNGFATNDPYAWTDHGHGRTWQIAHHWIIEHWHELRDGDVVDVEYILGERTEPKKSERETVHHD